MSGGASARPEAPYELVKQMRASVMVRQPQSHVVGQSADAGRLLRSHVARRVGQDGAVAGQRGTFSREHHLQVRLLGQRARGMGQRALEGLRRALGLGGHGGDQ